MGSVFAKGGDGSGTDRSTYLGKEKDADKSFVSSSGYKGFGGGGHGVLGGVSGGTGLDSSLLNNILSTPSSEKSHGRTSAFSPDEPRQQWERK